MERACVSLAATGIPVLDLEDTGSEAVTTIEQYGARAAADGADVIVLGCAGMADLCAELTERIGVPVVDGVAAAVGMASGMVRMGLRTSKRDEYARPPRAPRAVGEWGGAAGRERGAFRAPGRSVDAPVHNERPGKAAHGAAGSVGAPSPHVGDLASFA
jgi:allantoin racemase